MQVRQKVVDPVHVKQFGSHGSQTEVPLFAMFVPTGQEVKHDVPWRYVPDTHDRHDVAKVWQVAHGELQELHC